MAEALGTGIRYDDAWATVTRYNKSSREGPSSNTFCDERDMSVTVLVIAGILLIVAVGIALFLAYRETEGDFPPSHHPHHSSNSSSVHHR